MTKEKHTGHHVFMKNMNLEFIYFDDNTAENLMETFRLYGSKNRYEQKNPWIIYGITDKERNLFFTRGFFRHNSGEQEYQEYIFTYKNFSGQVNCNISIKSEKKNDRWIHIVESLEILEIKGNTMLDKSQLKEIIRFYEETYAFEFQQQLCRKLNLKSHLLSSFNIIRQHKIMLKNSQKWQDMGELLAEDFIFKPLCENDRIQFIDCIEKHSIDYRYFKNANFDYYMTDINHNFKMIQCAYISDGIKRCDEPDDHEYAIITENTSGTVLVWNCNDFRSMNGEIPFQGKKLVDIISFYHRFYYSFTDMLKNNKACDLQ